MSLARRLMLPPTEGPRCGLYVDAGPDRPLALEPRIHLLTCAAGPDALGWNEFWQSE
jgi:hypothetical protein